VGFASLNPPYVAYFEKHRPALRDRKGGRGGPPYDGINTHLSKGGSGGILFLRIFALARRLFGGPFCLSERSVDPDLGALFNSARSI